MFQYIENDEDAYNLFLIFQRVMEEEKTRSIHELYEKVEYEYYTTYVMYREVNQIEMDDISYGDEFPYENEGYDGNDGYDN